MSSMNLRVALISAITLAMLAVAPRSIFPFAAAANNGPRVDLSIGDTGPREVEDTTQKAIVRDYAAAWKTMAAALASNRADGLDSSFVGIARDQLAAACAFASPTVDINSKPFFIHRKGQRCSCVMLPSSSWKFLTEIKSCTPSRSPPTTSPS